MFAVNICRYYLKNILGKHKIPLDEQQSLQRREGVGKFSMRKRRTVKQPEYFVSFSTAGTDSTQQQQCIDVVTWVIGYIKGN